jgi:hypothetical protein
VAGIELHRPTQQLPGFCEHHPVAADHAEVAEALDVVRLQLQPGAQQPAHTDFSPSIWEWDADGVRGTAARMERLCVHALLVQL